MGGCENASQTVDGPVSTVPVPTTLSQVLQSTVLYPVFIANSIGNICVCLAISRTRSLRQRPGTSLLASLAVSDLCQLPFILFRLVWLYDFDAAVKACGLFSLMLVTLLYVSIFHMCLLSADRYAAIVHPLLYTAISTATRVRWALLVAWTAPVFSLAVVPHLLSNNDSSVFRSSIVGCSMLCGETSLAHRVHLILNVSVFVAIPFAVIVFTYCRIAVISWKQSNRVNPGEHLNPEMAQLRRKQKKEMKWMKTIALVVGAFVFSYIPTFVSTVVLSKHGPSSIPGWFLSVLLLLVVSNSALNPVIYVFRSNEFRRVFMKIFRRVPIVPDGESRIIVNPTTFQVELSNYGQIEELETPSTG